MKNPSLLAFGFVPALLFAFAVPVESADTDAPIQIEQVLDLDDSAVASVVDSAPDPVAALVSYSEAPTATVQTETTLSTDAPAFPLLEPQTSTASVSAFWLRC